MYLGGSGWSGLRNSGFIYLPTGSDSAFWPFFEFWGEGLFFPEHKKMWLKLAIQSILKSI